MGKKNKKKIIQQVEKPSPQTGIVKKNNFKYAYYFIIIIVVNVLIFGKSFQFKFVDLDDLINIVENSAYFKDLHNFFGGFSTSYIGSFYRPLLWGSWIIDAQFGGTEPFFYHLTNVGYHILCCSLLFHLLKLLKYNLKIALLCTLLFAVHPLFNQAIGWISGRNDTILTVFILASCIQYVLYLDTSKIKHFMGHIIFLLCALFTKETAIVLPILCVLFYHSFDMYKNKLTFKNKLYLFLIWGIVILGWYFIRDNALHSGILKNLNVADNGKYIISSKNEISGIEAFIKNYTFLFESFGKLIFPLHLSVYAHFDKVSAIIGIIGYIILLVVFFILKLPLKKIIFYMGWWFLFIIPPMFLYFSDGRYDYLEHRIYVPAIGIILLIMELCKKISFDKIKFILIPIIIILGVFSFIRIDLFYDAESFFKSAIKSSPSKAIPYRVLANFYEKNGNKNEALAYYKKLLINSPTEQDIALYLASQHLQQKKFDSAKMYLDIAEKMEKFNYEFYTSYADYYDKIQKTDSAILMYEKAIIADSTKFIPYHNIAFFALQKNDYLKAEKYYLKVLSLDKNQINSLSEIGVVYIKKGQLKEAIYYLNKAIEVNPTYQEAYANLYNVYVFLNNKTEIENLQKKARENGVKL